MDGRLWSLESTFSPQHLCTARKYLSHVLQVTQSCYYSSVCASGHYPVNSPLHCNAEGFWAGGSARCAPIHWTYHSSIIPSVMLIWLWSIMQKNKRLRNNEERRLPFTLTLKWEFASGKGFTLPLFLALRLITFFLFFCTFCDLSLKRKITFSLGTSTFHYGSFIRHQRAAK